MMHPTRLRSLVETPALAAAVDRNDLAPPSTFFRVRELESAWVIARGLRRLRKLSIPVRGNNRPIMLLPGFGAGEWSMQALKRVLVRHGFDAVDWGMGTNGGDVPALAPQVTDAIAALAQDRGQPVALIGWSLGGYLAREAARDLPAEVSTVITLGTPAWGGPKYSAAASFYKRRGLDLDEIENGTFERFERPIDQPVTAYLSKRDGVVNWRCCIDHWSPRVEHIEVDCPHIAMAFNDTIIVDVIERLGRLHKEESA